MLYLFPQRDKYRDYKFITTEEFVRLGEEEDVDLFRQNLTEDLLALRGANLPSAPPEGSIQSPRSPVMGKKRLRSPRGSISRR